MSSLWSESPYAKPVPSFPKPVPVPGVDPDTGTCTCVRFNPAWQPYILGCLEQMMNPATWNTTDPTELTTVRNQVSALMDMFGATQGCAGPPPAPPVTPDDDIDCKIASYLVRTCAKEVLQSAIFLVFPPAPELSLIERGLDAIPGVGDFLGTLGFTSKNIATFIATQTALPWVETAAEDTTWDLIGCAVYSGVRGLHEITAPAIPVIQAAIEAIEGIFPEFLQQVAGWFGQMGADVLNELANLSTTTDFNCAGCSGSTPTITGTDPSAYLPLRLEVSDGTVTSRQVRRINVSGAPLTDAGPEYSGSPGDAVTIAIPAPTIDVQIEGTSAGQFGGLDFVNGGGVTWSSPGSGGGVIGIEATVAAAASLELVAGATDLTGVSKLTFDGGTLTGPADDATYTPPGIAVGSALQSVMTEVTALAPDAWTVLASLALAAGTYLLTGAAILDNGGDGSGVLELDIFDGSDSVATALAGIGPGNLATVTIPSFEHEAGAPITLQLRARAFAAGVQANPTGVDSTAPATWLTAQLPGGGPAGPAGPAGPGMSVRYVEQTTDNAYNVAAWVLYPDLSTTMDTAEGEGLLCRLTGTLVSGDFPAWIAFRWLIDGATRLPAGILNDNAPSNYMDACFETLAGSIAVGSHTIELEYLTSGTWYVRPGEFNWYERLALTVSRVIAI